MVLITGATGFTGAHLAKRLLDDGKAVRLLVRKNSPKDYLQSIIGPLTQPGLSFADGDLLDYYSLEEALDGARQVYHCAGFISFQRSDRKKLVDINAKGTANMVNASLYKGVEKFLYVSSIAAIGRSSREVWYDETRFWKNDPLNSWYAISKYNGEREVWRAAEEGLNVVVANPSVILGPCRWNEGSGKLFDTIYKGLRYYPTGTTGFVDVRDVVQLLILLMEGPYHQERYILNAENLSWKEALTEMALALGKQPPARKASRSLLKLGQWASAFRKMFTGKPALVTRETLINSSLECRYHNEKIIKATGFRFRPVKETIAETAAMYLKEVAG